MKKCSDVMTKNPVCSLPGDGVVKVARLMQSKDIGSVPIIENEQTKQLVGMVTDRDLALRVVAKGRAPKSMTAEDVMSREVVTCQAGDKLRTALDAMSEHQLRRIPVVDDNNGLVGIIAQADIATRFDKPERTAELVKDISQSCAT